jgi:hypothetical protein
VVAKALPVARDATPPLLARKPAAEDPSDKKGGDWFGQNRSWLIPLLSGVGGMASSNSPYLGTALLQGLGQGAQAYAGEQRSEVELAGKQSETRRNDIGATTEAAALKERGIYTKDGLRMVNPVDGPPMTFAAWLQLEKQGRAPKLIGEDEVRGSAEYSGHTNQPVTMTGGTSGPAGGPGATGTAPVAGAGATDAAPVAGAGATDAAPVAGGAPAGHSHFMPEAKPLPPKTDVEASTGVGGAGESIMNEAHDRYFINQNAYAAAQKISAPLEAKIAGDAEDARSQRPAMNTLADKLLQIPKDSLLKADTLAPLTHNIGNYWNAALGRAAAMFPDKKEEIAKLMLNEGDLEKGVAADKYTAAMQFMMAGGAGQKALGALGEASRAIPGKHMTKEAAISVFQGLYKDQQRAIDRDAYLNDWKIKANSGDKQGVGLYAAQDAMRAFEKEHGDRYGREGNLFEDIMKIQHDKTHRHLFSDIQSGAISPDDIEKRKEWRHMSRWFRNYGG